MGGSPFVVSRPATDVLVTPDPNYGTDNFFINTANLVDADTGTSSDSLAGGGTSSPSYAPSIRIANDSTDPLGSAAIIGFEIEYEWTKTNLGEGAEVQVFFQRGTPGVTWFKYIVRSFFVSGEKTPKGREQFFFKGLNVTPPPSIALPIPHGEVATFVTIVNQGPSNSSSTTTLKVFDFGFITQDRIEHDNIG